MKISKELAKGSTPLLVLSVIAREDMYGYQIIKTVEKQSGDVFSMKEGTLYPILHTLESGGFLTAYWLEANGRSRKYYKITDKGLKQLEENRREWEAFSGAVNQVLGGAAYAGAAV